MAIYKLAEGGVILREYGKFIPNSNTNSDWVVYQAWLAQGNTPDPADISSTPNINWDFFLPGTIPINRGGTSLTTPPTTGQLLIGSSNGSYRLNTLKNGTNISILNEEGSITIGTNAEINTATNLGTGIGLYKQKVGTDLQFKSLSSTSKISITEDVPNSRVNLEVVESNLTLGNLGGVLPVSKGGTGSTTQNYVDLTSNQDVNGTKTYTGVLRARGSVNETPQGYSRLDIGVQNNSPRLLFENGGTVWQIDNDNNVFRWYTPGVTRLTLSSVGNLGLGIGNNTSNARLQVGAGGLAITTGAGVAADPGAGSLYIEGSFSAPRQSKFRVYKNLSQGLLAGITSKISYQLTTHDVLTEFDTSNNRFVATASGYYLFLTATTLAITASTRIVLMFYVNGAEHSRAFDTNFTSTTVSTIPASLLTLLNAGDYVEVYVNSSRGLNINQGTILTYFSGARIA